MTPPIILGLFAAPPIHPRAFLSPDNAIGFGLTDFAALAAAIGIVGAVLVASSARRWLLRTAERTGWCMLLLFVLPIVLRIALLPHSAAPTPSGADDFSFLLLADTLRHLRLANPPHALPQFFEQLFVLQEPTRSSMFPLGQGLVLALGWTIFGHPWAGVLLGSGALCALCYWMLRGWTTPGWALLGGVLAGMEFGPLCYWTNCYWGGAVSASAGCLVFGALPRLARGDRSRDAALLGLGLAIQLLTRPFEFVLLLLSVLLFWVPSLFRPIAWRRAVAQCGIAGAVLAAAGSLMALQNKEVTGSWTTLPYMLYRYQYAGLSTFTFQPNPVPHRQLNREEELSYRANAVIHGEGTDTPAAYVYRLVYRARFYRFFLLPPLYLAFIAFGVTVRSFRSLWVLLTLLVFALGSNFYPYFYPHYIAAVTCLFVLVSVVGLARLSRLEIRNGIVGHYISAGLVFLCAAQFLFWYGVHMADNEQVLFTAGSLETWDFINHGDYEGRIRIDDELLSKPGKQLVFVHYGPQHAFHEWVHNGADIDGARIVWAHDLGAAEDDKLRQYFPDRTAWVVEPDQHPPLLEPYVAERPDFENVH